mmetsp:Transcript_78741/g.155957  ORF Transcript_78741/g.155957 Transcript_78741/m.155957 type:complete len:116 (-) Transcript_78741:56-403(-)
MVAEWLCTTLHDLLQVSMVVTCVSVGWSLVSLLMGLLMPDVLADGSKFSEKNRSDERHSPAKEDAPESRRAPHREAEAEAAAAAAATALAAQHLDGQSLLEHYGLLGAAPGAWRC